MAESEEFFQQHVIDPEICIRCNTCEATCPVEAVTHDSRNYVVDAAKCNHCMACVPPCPTGAIDNWRQMARSEAYSVEEQLSWDVLPTENSHDSKMISPNSSMDHAPKQDIITEDSPYRLADYNASLPPWSAAHPYRLLYGPSAAESYVKAVVSGNYRVTCVNPQQLSDYDTHHIVLDFGTMPFPVLEGQSIAIIPPGRDKDGRPHLPRSYSIASPRNGERAGYNNLSLTVKRVLVDYQGNACRGVASNFLCDRSVGDEIHVIGPFGTSFLMPNHPKSHIVMICTGTGSAPMRAMTEWRRRLRASGKFEGGKLLLFFGARTPEELPYFGPLQHLPKDFMDSNFAFSRRPNQPKRYVQDVMRERAADLALLLKDENAYFYICGLKAMEEGVIMALRQIALDSGLDWPSVASALKSSGRLHIETY